MSIDHPKESPRYIHATLHPPSLPSDETLPVEGDAHVPVPQVGREVCPPHLSYLGDGVPSPHSLATSSELLPSQDSGAVLSSEQGTGVSAIEMPNAPNISDGKGTLLSYAADNSNDISVGFPQLSSTPTKK